MSDYGLHASALLSSPDEGLADRNREASEFLPHAMQPLFAADRKGVATSVASSVLLRLNERQLIVTADHAIKGAVGERGTQLSMMVANQIAEPGTDANEAHLSALPIALAHRHHDLAMAELDDIEPARLLPAPALFISERNLLPRRLPVRRPYLVAGYPIGLQRRRISEQTYKSQYYGVSVVEATPGEYDQHNFNAADYLLLNFDQEKPIDGAKGRRPPHPQGMSGGGVWAYGNVCDRVTPDNLLKLAGIVIEYREQPVPVLIAVRVGAVIDLADRIVGR
jgi:hypothetical protein